MKPQSSKRNLDKHWADISFESYLVRQRGNCANSLNFNKLQNKIINARRAKKI